MYSPSYIGLMLVDMDTPKSAPHHHVGLVVLNTTAVVTPCSKQQHYTRSS